MFIFMMMTLLAFPRCSYVTTPACSWLKILMWLPAHEISIHIFTFLSFRLNAFSLLELSSYYIFSHYIYNFNYFSIYFPLIHILVWTHTWIQPHLFLPESHCQPTCGNWVMFCCLVGLCKHQPVTYLLIIVLHRHLQITNHHLQIHSNIFLFILNNIWHMVKWLSC